MKFGSRANSFSESEWYADKPSLSTPNIEARIRFDGWADAYLLPNENTSMFPSLTSLVPHPHYFASSSAIVYVTWTPPCPPSFPTSSCSTLFYLL